MMTPVHETTDRRVLRLRLASMLDEHLDRADACAQDDPAVDGHLTAALQLDAAIRRINNGTYGTCRLCQAPIGAERLEAIPAAALCIDCELIPRPLLA